MYTSVAVYIAPRAARLAYQSTSVASSPAACQISSTNIARCLKLVGIFNGCDCAAKFNNKDLSIAAQLVYVAGQYVEKVQKMIPGC